MRTINPRRRAPRTAVYILSLALLAPLACIAAQVDGLYEGQVPVASEGEEERTPALGAALRQVLSKLSGVQQPAGRVIDAAVAEPQRYLQQLSYRRGGDAGGSLSLWARFDAAAVDALLRESGLPQWSAERPAVLVWLVRRRGGELEILAPDSGVDDSAVLDELRRRAWQRGIPLSFPLLDLDDRVRVQTPQLWQLDEAAIEEASARYTPGGVLVGRLESESTGDWVGRWWLREGGSVSRWTARAPSAAAAAAGAMDAVSERLAARYAVLERGESGSIEVRVSGVRTLGDYARVLSYLQGLDQVSRLSLSAARSDEFSFSMQVRGGAEGLRRVASFSDLLSAEPAAADDATVRLRLLP